MRVLILVAGAGAGYWTYQAMRTGKLQPTGTILASLAGLQAAGAIIAVGSLLLR